MKSDDQKSTIPNFLSLIFLTTIKNAKIFLVVVVVVINMSSIRSLFKVSISKFRYILDTGPSHWIGPWMAVEVIMGCKGTQSLQNEREREKAREKGVARC